MQSKHRPYSILVIICLLLAGPLRERSRLKGDVEASRKNAEGGRRTSETEPDIRVAPTPLYNAFHEVWRFANVLAQHR